MQYNEHIYSGINYKMCLTYIDMCTTWYLPPDTYPIVKCASSKFIAVVLVYLSCHAEYIFRYSIAFLITF